ncbi:C-type lectin domain family 4 member M-like isoform X2, partial [Clarias magur]
SGMDLAGNKWYILPAVCVVTLCLLLMMTITVLWIKLNNMTTERDQLQSSYNSLNVSRDQLQTSYNTLTTKKDQLQTSYDSLIKERDQLHTSYNTMTTKKDQLQTSYNSLSKERDQLQKQKDELQKNLTNLVGWIFFTSKLYYISSEKKSWPESRQDCRKRGLDLIVINSKEEQEFVEKLSTSKNYGVYIGLTDTKGVWRWVDGTSMTT